MDIGMDVTTFFARYYGGMYVLLSILFLSVGLLGRIIDMSKDQFFTVATGYNSMMLGLATVILHNVWVWDWPVVITIIGWSTLIKSMGKIGFAGLISSQAQKFKGNQFIESLMIFGIGAFLIWMSSAAEELLTPRRSLYGQAQALIQV